MLDINKLPNAFDTLNELLSKSENERAELYDLYYNIAKKIVDYRIKHKMTQKALAEKLEVSQVMVSKLESSEYNPTVELLWKVSKKMGLVLSIDMKYDSDNNKTKNEKSFEYSCTVNENVDNLKKI